MKAKIIVIFVCTLMIATAVPAVESLKISAINATVPSTPLSSITDVWQEMRELLASNGKNNNNFGWTVSLYGNTALIGALSANGTALHSGTAYVFIRNSTGYWIQQAQLNASDGVTGDYFGYSVSLYGDTALIGATDAKGQVTGCGSAYVFIRDIFGHWKQQAQLNASDGAAVDAFGCSVSLYGDTALIGAAGDDDKGTQSGSAYVFTRTGTTWTQQAKLLASDGEAFDWFGISVSLYGDTALIGSYMEDYNGLFDCGSAYIFTRTTATWTQTAHFSAKPSDGRDHDHFGVSVSLSGDTALIGADWNNTYKGTAYVFTNIAGTWTQQQKLLASDGAVYDSFGTSVSLYGDTALIGALNANGTALHSGSAYVFNRVGTHWTQQAQLNASEAGADETMGWSVSVYKDTAFIGAPYDDDYGFGTGSAYVFTHVGPDLIIYDHSQPGPVIKISDNIYDKPHWAAVTQIGKWTTHILVYRVLIKLQNDGTIPLSGHYINTSIVVPSSSIIKPLSFLRYMDTTGSFATIPIGGSATNGMLILPGNSRWLMLVVTTLPLTATNFQIGVHVRSASGSEDSVIFAP